MSARLIDFSLALALMLVLASAPRLRVVESPNVRLGDSLWASAQLNDPQWSKLSPRELAKGPAVVPAVPTTPAGAPDKAAPTPNAATSASPRDDNLITGASLDLPPVKTQPRPPARFDWRCPTEFSFEAGTRYWSIFADRGSVEIGPSFSPSFALTKFSTQRYGAPVEAKASF
jgi:hypothetical protein